MHRSLHLGFLFVTLASGCATDPHAAGGGGGGGKADNGGATIDPQFVPSELIGALSGVTGTFDTQADALASALPAAKANQNQQLAACASDLGVDVSEVYGRFGDCTASTNGPLAPNGTWQGLYSCGESYCAVQRLDDAEIVRFDGTAPVHTDSGNPLHAGAVAILVFDEQQLAGFVSTIGTDGTVALVPHLLVRVANTAFSEAPGPATSRPNVGDVVSFTFAPGNLRAVMIALSHDTDRLEFYMRYERFTYTNGGSLSEDLYDGRITGAASDGYVSNFGNNFSLPVH
jgi:hypothetical protein